MFSKGQATDPGTTVVNYVDCLGVSLLKLSTKPVNCILFKIFILGHYENLTENPMTVNESITVNKHLAINCNNKPN